MSALPRRTSRLERRVVLIFLALAAATSGLTVLAIDTEYALLATLVAAALSITAGSLAARWARVARGRAFLGERLVLTPLVWLGLFVQSFSNMTLFGGGGPEPGVVVWLLGGTWAWAGLGAGAFGAKRLYEREAALARLARRRGSPPASKRLVPILASAAALAVLAPLLVIGNDPVLIAAGALFAAVGALFVHRGFPGGVRSRLGRCLLLAGALALCLSLAPFGAILVRPLVSLDALGSWDRDVEIAERLALAASYALLGAWLLAARPFAWHEWRLGLRAQGSR